MNCMHIWGWCMMSTTQNILKINAISNGKSNLHSLIFPLVLPPIPALPTVRTEPLPDWFLLNGHTAPMKPLIRAIIIITRDHVSITHTVTNTVRLVITLPFFISILHLDILVLFIAYNALIFARRGRRAGFLVLATTPATRRRGFRSLRSRGIEMTNSLVRGRGAGFSFIIRRARTGRRLARDVVAFGRSGSKR